MELLNFINTHNNWKELLAAKPYCLDIGNDGDYYIFKYNMIESDFSEPIVCEARGCIVRFDTERNEWICVARAFDKFFNYGEKYSAVGDIDWKTAVVQQKVDGSLIKIWYDRDEWHISTNGTIDAFKASCGDTTYGDLVSRAIATMPDFWYALDTNYCYIFELTSPFNHIVIRYEGISIWFLARRNMTTFEEDSEIPEIENLRRPAVFPHHSLSECVEAAHHMGDDEEGYVVVDTFYNRIKVKGDEYLRLHKIRGNGPLTIVRVIEMWQSESLDDFVAYYPEYKEFVDGVIHAINHLIQISDIAFSTVLSYVNDNPNNRRTFARYATTYIAPVSSFLFARLDEKVHNAYQYFYTMRARSLASHIAKDVHVENEGVMEDE